MSPRGLAWSGQSCSPEASRPLVTGVTLPGRGFLQATQLGRRPGDRGSEEHSLLPPWRRCQSPIPEQHTLAMRLEEDWVVKLGPLLYCFDKC